MISNRGFVLFFADCIFQCYVFNLALFFIMTFVIPFYQKAQGTTDLNYTRLK